MLIDSFNMVFQALYKFNDDIFMPLVDSFDLMEVIFGLFFAFTVYRFIIHPLLNTGFSTSIFTRIAGSLSSGSSDKADKKFHSYEKVVSYKYRKK